MPKPKPSPKRTNWKRSYLKIVKAHQNVCDMYEMRGKTLREERENHLSAVCGLADAAQNEVNRLNSQIKPSWLRRNWVEIVVMTGVLGACALLVWWAWRG